LTGRYGERVVNPSTALYGTLFNDQGQVTEDRALNLTLRNQRQISDDLGVEMRLEYAEQAYRADYPYADDAGNRYINRDDSLGRWWSGEVRLLYTGLANHKLVAGVEAKHDVLTRQRNFDVGVTIDEPLDVDSPRHRVGVYVQDEWRFADHWRLNAGLRHDAYSDGQATTNPRLGLIWLASEQTTFKLLAGRAYRAPNAYERDYACCGTYLGNADLSPETIRTVEAIWEQRLAQNQTLRVSAFDYRVRDLIGQVETADGQLQYQNQAEITARGLETSWRANWQSGAQLVASLAYSHTEDANGERPGYSPRWLAKLRGSVPLPNPGQRWLLAVEARAQSATDYVWNDSQRHLPLRLVVDATLTSARLTPGLDAFLRVRNVFDRRFDHPGTSETAMAAIPGDRRTWEIGVSYAF
ncbi:MAG: TonB-dependent receptor, partial [Propionivibrio sp.]